jgi:hypothetical protein
MVAPDSSADASPLTSSPSWVQVGGVKSLLHLKTRALPAGMQQLAFLSIMATVMPLNDSESDHPAAESRKRTSLATFAPSWD